LPALLEMQGIVKSYGTVRANRSIDLTVPEGVVRRPAREKRIRQEHPDEGAVRHDRAGCRPDRVPGEGTRRPQPAQRSPRDRMIHQHFTLGEAMTVARTMLGWSQAGTI